MAPHNVMLRVESVCWKMLVSNAARQIHADRTCYQSLDDIESHSIPERNLSQHHWRRDKRYCIVIGNLAETCVPVVMLQVNDSQIPPEPTFTYKCAVDTVQSAFTKRWSWRASVVHGRPVVFNGRRNIPLRTVCQHWITTDALRQTIIHRNDH